MAFGENASLGGEGWRAKVMVSDAGFDYDRGVSSTGAAQSDVKGDANSIEVGVGKQWISKSASTRGSLYISAVHRETDLSPVDHGSKVIGGDTGIKIQGEINHKINDKWWVEAMGSYVGADDFDDAWSRFRAGYRYSSINFGPEIVLMDGPDYDVQRYGLFVNGYKIGNSTSLGFSLGGQDGNRGSRGGYISIGMSTDF